MSWARTPPNAPEQRDLNGQPDSQQRFRYAQTYTLLGGHSHSLFSGQPGNL